MACVDNNKPISGASGSITLDQTDQTLDGMGVTPHPNATSIRIDFDLAPAGQTNPIGRMKRDTAFVLSATAGEQIFGGSKKVLSIDEFLSEFRAVGQDITAYVSQFEES